MSKQNKIQELKTKMEKELNSPQPNMAKVKKFKDQIIMLGLGLTAWDIKPF